MYCIDIWYRYDIDIWICSDVADKSIIQMKMINDNLLKPRLSTNKMSNVDNISRNKHTFYS